jgi:hypothetical protein
MNSKIWVKPAQELGALGVWRSEVKEENRAGPEPGDMSAAGYPARTADHTNVPSSLTTVFMHFQG